MLPKATHKPEIKVDRRKFKILKRLYVFLWIQFAKDRRWYGFFAIFEQRGFNWVSTRFQIGFRMISDWFHIGFRNFRSVSLWFRFHKFQNGFTLVSLWFHFFLTGFRMVSKVSQWFRFRVICLLLSFVAFIPRLVSIRCIHDIRTTRLHIKLAIIVPIYPWERRSGRW